VVENPVKLARAGLIEEVGQAGVEEPRGWGRTDREDERWTDASGAQGGATHKAERRTRRSGAQGARGGSGHGCGDRRRPCKVPTRATRRRGRRRWAKRGWQRSQRV